MTCEGKPVDFSVCLNEEESWDTIWKWSWFTREVWLPEYWKENQNTLKPIFSLLSRLQVKSILDCSCGLGVKTVLFARMGYEVEGSDSSTVAIRCAPHLAKEEGVTIKFFRSRYEELGEKCRRKYDCVYSDNFDEIGTGRTLESSARGIYSVLEKGGRLLFCGVPPEWSKFDLRRIIDEEWKKRKRFEVFPPYQRNDMRVIRIEIPEKTLEGIRENRLFLIEAHSAMRVEIASVMNPRIKWTFQDYAEVLKGVGFREVECIKEEGQIFNVGIK